MSKVHEKSGQEVIVLPKQNGNGAWDLGCEGILEEVVLAYGLVESIREHKGKVHSTW